MKVRCILENTKKKYLILKIYSLRSYSKITAENECSANTKNNQYDDEPEW